MIQSIPARHASSRNTGPSPGGGVDNIGILFANGMIDADELGTLRMVERWLGLVRRARGIADGHVGRLWGQILAGTRGGRTPHGVDGGARRTAADIAWERLLLLRAAFTDLDLLPAARARLCAP